jgi:hypothetical protein
MNSRLAGQVNRTAKWTTAKIDILARRAPARAVCLLLCMLVLSVPASAKKAISITFDAPGAGTAAGQGTFGQAINPAGEIAGYYLDANNVFHGLIRARDGTLTTVDVPAGGTGAFQGTFLVSINPAGAIAGDYVDANNVEHGIVRARDGTITIIDVVAAGTGAFQGTHVLNINPAGEISGRYVDANGVSHGFVRAPDGTITIFDIPGMGTAPGQGIFLTSVDGLNPAGATTGTFVDPSNVLHSFVRAPDGTITIFDVPGAGTGAGQGSFPAGINPGGVIVGANTDSNNVTHGYVRTPDGTITIFDVPGAGTGPGAPCTLLFVPTCQGTIPENINPGGAITGEYVDTSRVFHGFLRTRTGTFITFDVLGAGTGPGQGTIPFSNNPANLITGSFIDANGVSHGFLATA